MQRRQRRRWQRDHPADGGEARGTGRGRTRGRGRRCGPRARGSGGQGRGEEEEQGPRPRIRRVLAAQQPDSSADEKPDSSADEEELHQDSDSSAVGEELQQDHALAPPRPVQIGDNVQVYWTEERAWYSATVRAMHLEEDSTDLERWCVRVLYAVDNKDGYHYFDGLAGSEDMDAAVQWRPEGCRGGILELRDELCVCVCVQSGHSNHPIGYSSASNWLTPMS